MPPTTERRPVTETTLRRDLEEIGLQSGATVVVHSSLRAIGSVLGGAPTVVRALLASLGDEGTLAMPAATPHCADPSTWREPRIPEALIEEMRENLPPFDPRTTPTAMGAIPETFRNWPGTLRSDHPLESVCARGPRAAEITRDHPLAFSEGPGSPFARLHGLDSRILLLGVGFNRCTALHFAESVVAKRRTTTVRFPRVEGGLREWVEVPNVADDLDTHFPAIGAQFLADKRAKEGSIGEARSFYFSMRDLVEFARAYFERVL
ncbi:MAG TPA: AAC(3) family N-acetyltransferase [Vicinamibacteria bacterium]|nr:AAC(3) family N-acetyltransferase [Vicinamibacteria bacterium]